MTVHCQIACFSSSVAQTCPSFSSNSTFASRWAYSQVRSCKYRAVCFGSKCQRRKVFLHRLGSSDISICSRLAWNRNYQLHLSWCLFELGMSRCPKEASANFYNGTMHVHCLQKVSELCRSHSSRSIFLLSAHFNEHTSEEFYGFYLFYLLTLRTFSASILSSLSSNFLAFQTL